MANKPTEPPEGESFENGEWTPYWRLEVWYNANDPNDRPQVHDKLDIDRALTGLGAFTRDMEALRGEGCAAVKLSIHYQWREMGMRTSNDR